MSNPNDVFAKFSQHAVWDFIISRGIIALIIGILFIAMPLATMKFLCLLIGIILLLNGLVATVKAIRSKTAKKTFLVYGLTCLLLGIIILMNQALSVSVLIMFFAVLVLITGLSQIFAAIKAKSTPGSARALAALTGVLSLILGLALLMHPNIGEKVIPIIIGIYFIAFGVLAIATGTVLRKAVKNIGQ